MKLYISRFCFTLFFSVIIEIVRIVTGVFSLLSRWSCTPGAVTPSRPKLCAKAARAPRFYCPRISGCSGLYCLGIAICGTGHWPFGRFPV